MDTLTAIATRHSIRRFTKKPVSEDILKAILYAGFSAPTAHNRTPVHFVVVREEETKARIAGAYRYASMLSYADTGIVVCVDTNTETSDEFVIADASAALQNMLLAAHSMDLGAVWCGVLKDSDWYQHILQILDLPENIRPVGLMVLGYTDKPKRENRTDRYNESRIHREGYNKRS